jgi:transposase-like protein
MDGCRDSARGSSADRHFDCIGSHAGYGFPPAIIRQAIWLYLRFTLSLGNVENLLAERDWGLL